jgi:glutamyl-tRNA reductase
MDLYLYEFEANSSLPRERLSRPLLEVKTCQRSFLLAWEELPVSNCRRSFRGVEAYEFLLRFASGLESEIKGETDVFGQLKTAIKTFTEQHPEADQEKLFSRLFEDTKEIRAQYLQGIGGNTYGALSRRLLSPNPSSNVLILGAGQISKSVAPYFADSKLTLFNRTGERLLELKSDLEKKGYHGITYTSNESELPDLIRASNLILIATPAASALDESICKHVALLPASRRPVILHLGGQAHEISHFESAGVPALSLSDLFSIEREQTNLREKQIHQALDACRKRALLRSLSRSISIPHGWEDLALFT